MPEEVDVNKINAQTAALELYLVHVSQVSSHEHKIQNPVLTALPHRPPTRKFRNSEEETLSEMNHADYLVAPPHHTHNTLSGNNRFAVLPLPRHRVKLRQPCLPGVSSQAW